MWQTYFGISSARWVITSGVPTANAPFSIPRQNVKPLLVYPVEFCHSFQTKSEEAYPNPFVCGKIEQTRMVTKNPASVKKPPNDSRVGRARLAYKTTKQDDHTQTRYATNTCHLWISNPGWKRAYMETVWAAMI